MKTVVLNSRVGIVLTQEELDMRYQQDWEEMQLLEQELRDAENFIIQQEQWDDIQIREQEFLKTIFN